MEDKALSVQLLGPIPPPFGGVAVHLQRLFDHLIDLGVDSRLWLYPNQELGNDNSTRVRPYSRQGLLAALQKSPRGIVHFHWIPGWLGMSYRLGYAKNIVRRHRFVVSLHNTRIDTGLAGRNIMRRWLDVGVFRNCDAMIFPNEDSREQGLAVGCRPERAQIIPEYIQPKSLTTDPATLPESVQSFIGHHKPLLASLVSLVTRNGGVDLYGLDMMIDLLKRIREQFPQIGLVVCLPTVGDEEYFAELRNRATRYGVADRMCWVTESLPEVTPIWAAADLFLRPTATDGDALSVREALAVGTPVLASDCVPRPEGCRTFVNRDGTSLMNGAITMLEYLDAERTLVQRLRQPNHAEMIVDLYRELMSD